MILPFLSRQDKSLHVCKNTHDPQAESEKFVCLFFYKNDQDAWNIIVIRSRLIIIFRMTLLNHQSMKFCKNYQVILLSLLWSSPLSLWLKIIRKFMSVPMRNRISPFIWILMNTHSSSPLPDRCCFVP